MWLLLVPVSWIYACVVRMRNLLFDVGLLRVCSVSVPVISIGNLTAGGTGKTPFTEYVIRHLLERKKRIVVLSRGYRRSSGQLQIIDGENVEGLSFQQTGDEPLQLARKFRGITVIVHPRRARSARLAVERGLADVLVMDDGFQHRALHRDLDIVLIDVSREAWTMRMLPAGLKREPISSLRRADVVASSRVSGPDHELPGHEAKKGAFSVKVQFKPSRLVSLSGRDHLELESLKGKACVLFSGIGNPASFRTTVETLGVRSVECRQYPDHHDFGEADLQDLRQVFLRSGAQLLLTTEKDAIRLLPREKAAWCSDLPVYFVEIVAVIVQGEPELRRRLDEAVR